MSSKIISRINKFLSHIFVLIIHLYKYIISPVLPNSCRFLPTCSDYGIDALKNHGVIHGGCLTLKRILKCNPFGGHGIDHVPKKTKIKRRRCQN